MAGRTPPYLSRRLQQIMDLAYELGSVSAADVERLLEHAPSNSTARTQLRVLEEKGYLIHREDAGRYLYSPTRPKDSAAKAAMQRFLQTFVNGSASMAFATLLSAKDSDLTLEEFDQLERMLQERKAMQAKDSGSGDAK